MAKIKLTDGNEYEFAPLRFTQEACELLEAQDSLGDDNKIGKFARILRVNVRDSLMNGGLSAEEADKALALVPIEMKEDSVLTQIVKALMGE